MKKLVSLFITGVVLFIAPTTSFSENPVQIDVLYMNHGPMQPTLRELRKLFPEYGDKIMVSWYDFESDEGQRFKSKMGISHHIPLVIWVDGRSELMNNGRKIKLEGFPTGSGPSVFQGKWKLEDLAGVLDQATGGKK
jgi:hypothetical protein